MPTTAAKLEHRPTVVIGLLGTSLDVGKGPRRWERWRPTVALCQREDFLVDRLELIHGLRATSLAEAIERDIASVSPETQVVRHVLDIDDPWDFEQVYSALHDFAAGYRFDPEREDYLVHITTGTHVAQICSFLLTEARYFPARLVQTSPPRRASDQPGEIRIIDLDLSKYDRIASRFAREHEDAVTSLKSGIATRNAAFNALIDRIEHVAARTEDPMLLTGPTGAGKSRLAGRIFDLRRRRRVVTGAFVEVNCATLRGDAAMSTLFGHRKGAFTGATADRPGLLRAADKGMIFLDEIGELGLDEQAMLLRALEERRFLPLGADREVSSEFQLIAGTNRDLATAVCEGRFREDLLARINLWTFELPALRARTEDIEPNLDYELEAYATRRGQLVRFNREARRHFLDFAASPEALWTHNFRDLSAAVTRMATLAPGGRITEAIVDEEIARLREAWQRAGAPTAAGSEAGARGGVDPARASGSAAESDESLLAALLGPEQAAGLDLFDRVQLATAIRVCRQSRSLSEAGRRLFAASRSRRRSTNDSDRVRKYLGRFGLDWEQVAG